MAAFGPRGFKLLKALNYSPRSTPDGLGELFRNVRNTQIDVVLETERYLFIGEAKHLMPLEANGSLVLVHQLIRQYVMVKILLKLIKLRDRLDNSPEKKIVPFLVCDDVDDLAPTAQVRFMIHEGWLRDGLVMNWGAIHLLHSPPGTGTP